MTRKILSSALLFIIVAATVTFTALCDGWRSGHDGICTISALTPIYNSTMGVLLILGETWLVWVPVLLVLIAVVRHASKYIKKPAFWVTFTIVIAIIIAINIAQPPIHKETGKPWFIN